VRGCCCLNRSHHPVVARCRLHVGVWVVFIFASWSGSLSSRGCLRLRWGRGCRRHAAVVVFDVDTALLSCSCLRLHCCRRLVVARLSSRVAIGVVVAWLMGLQGCQTAMTYLLRRKGWSAGLVSGLERDTTDLPTVELRVGLVSTLYRVPGTAATHRL
jgi:hypothetical protein